MSSYHSPQFKYRNFHKFTCIMVKVVESRACLTRFVWPRRAMQVGTVEAMSSLFSKQGSRMTPRSLVSAAGVIYFPNKVRRKSSTLLTIALVPEIINIVLLGFIRS